MTATPLPPYKHALLNACTTASVLTFGTYTLKSGRQSPYFFNAGLLHTATLIDILGAAYAATILDYIRDCPPSSKNDFADFDVIFGPSYKGIPLAISTLTALHHSPLPHNYSSKSYAFNRKEQKDHGEGGGIVGCPLKGKKVLIVDDVVTAGTALREAVGIIEAEGGMVVGVVVVLDRGERMGGEDERKGEDGLKEGGKEGEKEGEKGRRSAVQELRVNLGLPVLAVLTLDDLIGFAGGERSREELERLEAYRERYFASE